MENKGNKTRPIEIKRSRIEGQGVFALRSFKKGDKVYSFPRGKIIGIKEAGELPKTEKRYLDKIAKDKFEIIEPPGRYVNHSCSPNVYEKKRAAYALKSIKKGEEITFDYDKSEYLERQFWCHCGLQYCRGVVKGLSNSSPRHSFGLI